MTLDRCSGKKPGRSLQPGILFMAVLMAGSSLNCDDGRTPPTLTFWPVAGTYSGTLQVAIRDTTSGATIHYTTDGSTPTESSPIYTAPITVSANTTVNGSGHVLVRRCEQRGCE